MASSVTSTQITHGLMSDPRYSEWAGLDVVIKQIARLPEIMGSSRMAERVTFRGILQLFAEMFDDLLSSEVSLALDQRTSRILRGISNGCLETIKRHGAKYDRHEPIIVPNSFGFSEDMQLEYLAGRLTYADLLRLQPSIFVPIINPRQA